MVQCVACGRFAPGKGEVARCSKCAGTFHRLCVGLSDGSRTGVSWSCPNCKPKKPKGDNAETPVKGLHSEGSGDEDSRQEHQASPTRSEATLAIVAANSATAAEGVSLMRRELAEYVAEMRDFRREMEEHRVLIASVNARVEAVEHRLDQLAQREATLPPPSAVVTELEHTVAQLRQELEDRDQEALISDLEIGHLPEEKGENIVHAVTLLATRLGVSIDERDIVFAERVGSAPALVQASGDGSVGGKGTRSRRVVVRLARRSLRDELLRAARVRRTLTVADVGGAEAATRGRIFLNERLTRSNRQLFYRVREECRKHHWRFSWTRRGRVFARQADGKQAYQIRSEADFLRVFAVASILN